MNSMIFVFPSLTLLISSSVLSSPVPDERLTAFKFFMGPGPENFVQNIAFRPEDGLRLRENFEQKYGPRGRDLIESFGQGLRPLDASLSVPDYLTMKPQQKKKKHTTKNNSSTKKQIVNIKKG